MDSLHDTTIKNTDLFIGPFQETDWFIEKFGSDLGIEKFCSEKEFDVTLPDNVTRLKMHPFVTRDKLNVCFFETISRVVDHDAIKAYFSDKKRVWPINYSTGLEKVARWAKQKE